MLIVAGALDDDVRLFVPPTPPTSDAPAATSIITLLLKVLELLRTCTNQQRHSG